MRQSSRSNNSSGALRSQYLALRKTRTRFEILFQPADEVTFGLTRRKEHALRKVASVLRHARPLTFQWEADQLFAVFDLSSSAHLRAVIVEIDEILDRLKRERLYPRMVEEMLNISARERIRWTKDGRLKSSGSGAFKRGSQQISFPLYRGTMIAQLARDPEKLVKWRDEDGKRGVPSRQPPRHAHSSQD